MNGVTQLFFGTLTFNSAAVSEGRYRRQGFSGLFARIGIQLNHFSVVLKTRVSGVGLYASRLYSDPREGPRQAYLLSELRDCSSGQRLLCQEGTSRLLKLRGVVVSTLRTIWRWC